MKGGEQGPGLAVHWPLLLSSCALASAATCAAYLCFSCHVSVSARSRGARGARQPRSGDDAAPAACASSRVAGPRGARRRGGLRPYGYAGSERASARAGHRRCCAPPPRVTRPRRDPFSVTTTRARGFLSRDCADSRYPQTPAAAPAREYYHRTCAPTRDCFTEHHRSTAHGPRHTPTPHYYRLALAVLK